MSKRQILGVIGIWVIILPFLGLPSSWKTILFVLTGLGICALAYSTRRSNGKMSSDQNSGADNSTSNQQAFVENKES